MSEKIFDAQNNYGWGLTLNMTGKAPAVSKRIFNTLSEAQAYADDFNDSAIEGLLLSVVADENEKNNGAYFVQTVKMTEEAEPAVLIRLGTGDLDEINALIEDEATKRINADSQLRREFTEADEAIKATIGVIEEGETVKALIDELKIVTEENGKLIVDNKTVIDEYTVNGKKISEEPVLNSDDIEINDTYTTLNQPAINVMPGDVVTTAISKLEVTLANTTLALTAAINDLENKIGSPSEYDDEGNLTKQASGLYALYEELSKNHEPS